MLQLRVAQLSARREHNIRPRKRGEVQTAVAALLNNRIFRLPDLLSQG